MREAGCASGGEPRGGVGRQAAAGHGPAGEQHLAVRGQRTGTGPKLAARTNPGSRAKQSSPPSSGPASAVRPTQRSVPRPRAGWSRRSRSAERYRFTVECSSSSWDSTLYRPQSAGWGSHGSAGRAPWPVRLKPKPGPAADQGRGTRQPSRPGYSPWVRKNRGSWRAWSRDIGDLGQAQFLTLVDIGRAGQGEQHQRGRPGAPGAGLGVAVAEGDEPGDGLRGEPLLQPVAARRAGHVVVADHPWGAGSAGHRERRVDRGAELDRLPAGQDQLEVEDLRQTAGLEVWRERLGHVVPDLADGRPRPGEAVGRVGVQDGPPGPVERLQFGPVPVRGRRVQRTRAGEVGQPGILEDPVRHVHPQPGHAAVEPEPDHVLEQGGNVRVVPVPVGLAGIEQVQVPLASPLAGRRPRSPGSTPSRRTATASCSAAARRRGRGRRGR